MDKSEKALVQAQQIAKSKFGMNISDESLKIAMQLVNKKGGMRFLKDKSKIKTFAENTLKNEKI